MKSFTCTNIVKDDNNQVISYELQDSAGKTLQVSSKKLKLMLESNKIAVVNLMLRNNKIVEDPSYQVKVMLAKLRIFGGTEETTHESDCGHEYYVLENPDTTIVYIPDDVEYLIKDDNFYGKPDFCNINCKLLKVIGGSGLTSAYHMFRWCEAQSIDLSLLDTSKVTIMEYMFDGCEAQSIDLSSFDTSKVTNMEGMFGLCKTKSLDLSSFNTSNVKDMGSMFLTCAAQSLNLSSFDTSNVTNMKDMFVCCKAQSLDLSSFDTSSVTDMEDMFKYCEAQSIDLSSFDTSNVTNMLGMFYKCEAQVKATDRKILDELYNR